jgi:hypothetical protein
MSFEWHYMIDFRSIWPEGSQSNAWEATSREHLRWIFLTDTGKLLLKAIRHYGKWVVVSQYAGSACNATAGVRTGLAADGRPYGAQLGYSPHVYERGTTCHGTAPNNNGNLPDEVFFHELVHALRIVSGNLAINPTLGGLKDYDLNEEFHAILVTNIYISDPTNRIKTGLLRDHKAGARPLEPELAGSFEFFESSLTTYGLVREFCTDHPGLSGDLAKIPAPFNPIAAYVSDPARAQSHSLKARAFIRDGNEWAVAFANFLQKIVP